MAHPNEENKFIQNTMPLKGIITVLDMFIFIFIE